MIANLSVCSSWKISLQFFVDSLPQQGVKLCVQFSIYPLLWHVVIVTVHVNCMAFLGELLDVFVLYFNFGRC